MFWELFFCESGEITMPFREVDKSQYFNVTNMPLHYAMNEIALII